MKKKEIECEICHVKCKRAQGYGSHLRSAHPDVYSLGRRDYGSLGAVYWSLEPLMAEIAEHNVKAMLEGFEEEMNDGLSNDPVNHPPHYTFGRFEVIEVLEDWFPHDPLLWQVCKYLARAGRKGPALEDLQKAEFYLKRRIKSEEGGL